MAAKYTLVVKADGTPSLDLVTGAQFASMPIKVGKIIANGTKRLFTSREQVLKLDDEQLLKRLNYAEDLLVRAEITAANTPKGEKEAHRAEARLHWAQQDKAEGTNTLIDYLLGGPSQAMLNSKLEAYWEENCKPEAAE